MLRRDFHYELPPALIADAPLPVRSASRLLHMEGAGGALSDRAFRDLPQLLSRGDLLVFNDTRVFPARLFAHKRTGGKVEVLVERVLDARTAWVQLRAGKSTREGSELELEGGARATVLARDGDLFKLGFDTALLDHAERHGHVPLPPYIRRPDTAADRERYQTVFARHTGAVAAPTAGLHFDAGILDALDAAGIAHTYVTLHVGAGTFQPVRSEQVEDHVLHAEYARVDARCCDAITTTQSRGGRVVAVGTTVVRSLETAAAGGTLAPFAGDTRLFIHPGFRFRVVDRLLTNFHLPESTLLMLVCAFAGKERTLAAYRHAVARRYRFFSYGDAMLVDPA